MSRVSLVSGKGDTWSVAESGEEEGEDTNNRMCVLGVCEAVPACL